MRLRSTFVNLFLIKCTLITNSIQGIVTSGLFERQLVIMTNQSIGRLNSQHLVIFFSIKTTTGGPSSRLEKKQTINPWKRHALCYSVLSYERNRWEFEYAIRNSMGNEIWLKTKTKSSFYYRNISDSKSSLKRQKSPETTADTRDMRKF